MAQNNWYFNTQFLRCKLVEIASKYVNTMFWGYDCDVQELECLMRRISRYVALLELLEKCRIPATTLREIEVFINDLRKLTFSNKLCTDC